MITDIPRGNKITIYENAIEINQAHSLVKGEFSNYFNNEILKYCKENNIKYLYLTDSQTTDKDIWGLKYGFSGRFHCGTRYLYLDFIEDKSMNDGIEICLPLEEDDQEFNNFIINKFFNNDNKLFMNCLKYSISIKNEREYKGKVIRCINNYN